MPYDHVKDFVPIVLVAGVPNVLVVHPSVPVNSVKELIAYGKANPGKLNFASSGSGTSIHLAGELFKALTGVACSTYRTRAVRRPCLDLLGGQVQLMFDNLPSALPHIRAGKLKALAVTSASRAPALPDVPTIAEAGVPGFEASSWFGLLAPAGAPRDIVVKVNGEVTKWLASADAKEKLTTAGANVAAARPKISQNTSLSRRRNGRRW